MQFQGSRGNIMDMAGSAPDELSQTINQLATEISALKKELISLSTKAENNPTDPQYDKLASEYHKKSLEVFRQMLHIFSSSSTGEIIASGRSQKGGTTKPISELTYADLEKLLLTYKTDFVLEKRDGSVDETQIKKITTNLLSGMKHALIQIGSLGKYSIQGRGGRDVPRNESENSHNNFNTMNVHNATLRAGDKNKEYETFYKIYESSKHIEAIQNKTLDALHAKMESGSELSASEKENLVNSIASVIKNLAFHQQLPKSYFDSMEYIKPKDMPRISATNKFRKTLDITNAMGIFGMDKLAETSAMLSDKEGTYGNVSNSSSMEAIDKLKMKMEDASGWFRKKIRDMSKIMGMGNISNDLVKPLYGEFDKNWLTNIGLSKGMHSGLDEVLAKSHPGHVPNEQNQANLNKKNQIKLISAEKSKKVFEDTFTFLDDGITEGVVAGIEEADPTTAKTTTEVKKLTRRASRKKAKQIKESGGTPQEPGEPPVYVDKTDDISKRFSKDIQDIEEKRKKSEKFRNDIIDYGKNNIKDYYNGDKAFTWQVRHGMEIAPGTPPEILGQIHKTGVRSGQAYNLQHDLDSFKKMSDSQWGMLQDLAKKGETDHTVRASVRLDKIDNQRESLAKLDDERKKMIAMKKAINEAPLIDEEEIVIALAEMQKLDDAIKKIEKRMAKLGDNILVNLTGNQSLITKEVDRYTKEVNKNQKQTEDVAKAWGKISEEMQGFVDSKGEIEGIYDLMRQGDDDILATLRLQSQALKANITAVSEVANLTDGFNEKKLNSEKELINLKKAEIALEAELSRGIKDEQKILQAKENYIKASNALLKKQDNIMIEIAQVTKKTDMKEQRESVKKMNAELANMRRSWESMKISMASSLNSAFGNLLRAKIVVMGIAYVIQNNLVKGLQSAQQVLMKINEITDEITLARASLSSMFSVEGLPSNNTIADQMMASAERVAFGKSEVLGNAKGLAITFREIYTTLRQMASIPTLKGSFFDNMMNEEAMKNALKNLLNSKEITQAVYDNVVKTDRVQKPYLARQILMDKQTKDMAMAVRALTTIDPTQGKEGALFSLREALSGDFISLKKRFEIQPEFIAQAEGISMTKMKEEPTRFLSGLSKYFKANFRDTMPALINETLQGNISKVQSYIEKFFYSVGTGSNGVISVINRIVLEPIIKELDTFFTSGSFVSLIGKLKKQIENIIVSSGTTFNLIFGILQKLTGSKEFSLATNVFDKLGVGADWFLQKVNELITYLNGVLGSNGDKVYAFLQSLSNTSQRVFDIVTKFTDQLIRNVIPSILWGLEKILNILNSMPGIFQNIGSLMLATGFVTGFGNMANIIGGTKDSLMNIYKGASIARKGDYKKIESMIDAGSGGMSFLLGTKMGNSPMVAKVTEGVGGIWNILKGAIPKILLPLTTISIVIGSIWNFISTFNDKKNHEAIANYNPRDPESDIITGFRTWIDDNVLGMIGQRFGRFYNPESNGSFGKQGIDAVSPFVAGIEKAIPIARDFESQIKGVNESWYNYVFKNQKTMDDETFSLGLSKSKQIERVLNKGSFEEYAGYLSSNETTKTRFSDVYKKIVNTFSQEFVKNKNFGDAKDAVKQLKVSEIFRDMFNTIVKDQDIATQLGVSMSNELFDKIDAEFKNIDLKNLGENSGSLIAKSVEKALKDNEISKFSLVISTALTKLSQPFQMLGEMMDSFSISMTQMLNSIPKFKEAKQTKDLENTTSKIAEAFKEFNNADLLKAYEKSFNPDTNEGKKFLNAIMAQSMTGGVSQYTKAIGESYKMPSQDLSKLSGLQERIDSIKNLQNIGINRNSLTEPQIVKFLTDQKFEGSPELKEKLAKYTVELFNSSFDSVFQMIDNMDVLTTQKDELQKGTLNDLTNFVIKTMSSVTGKIAVLYKKDFESSTNIDAKSFGKQSYLQTLIDYISKENEKTFKKMSVKQMVAFIDVLNQLAGSDALPNNNFADTAKNFANSFQSSITDVLSKYSTAELNKAVKDIETILPYLDKEQASSATTKKGELETEIFRRSTLFVDRILTSIKKKSEGTISTAMQKVQEMISAQKEQGNTDNVTTLEQKYNDLEKLLDSTVKAKFKTYFASIEQALNKFASTTTGRKFSLPGSPTQVSKYNLSQAFAPLYLNENSFSDTASLKDSQGVQKARLQKELQRLQDQFSPSFMNDQIIRGGKDSLVAKAGEASAQLNTLKEVYASKLTMLQTENIALQEKQLLNEGGLSTTDSKRLESIDSETAYLSELIKMIEEYGRAIEKNVGKSLETTPSLKDSFYNTWKDIVAQQKTFDEMLVEDVKHVSGAMDDAFTNVLFERFKGNVEASKDVWDSFLKDMEGTFLKTIAEMMKRNLIQTLFGQDSMQGVMDKLTGNTDKKTSQEKESSGGLLGGLFSGIGKLFGFADGGMITEPTIGLIGERGTTNPEWIFNNNQLKAVVSSSVQQAQQAKGGGGREVYITNNFQIDASGQGEETLAMINAKMAEVPHMIENQLQVSINENSSIQRSIQVVAQGSKM